MACVPHSASATSRACGNADCSPLLTPGRPNHDAFSTLSATSTVVPSIATNRRPANQRTRHRGTDPSGVATRRNSASTGSGPSRARAWKIADFDGSFHDCDQPDRHDSPSVNSDSTSSYEPSECRPIPIAK